MTDKAPHFPTSTVGRVPTVTVIVKFPREFRVADFAALVARASYRIRWIRRGKVEKRWKPNP